MATTKNITITDLFPSATVDSTGGSESITIPLADLSAASTGGLSVAELTTANSNNGDGRKVGFALIRTMGKALSDIKSSFDAIDNAVKAWATGTDFLVNDYVKDSNKIYKCTNAHTAGNTFAGDAANWQEQTLTQDPDNFTITENAARYASGSFGTSTISQIFSVGVTYEGTNDIKNES